LRSCWLQQNGKDGEYEKRERNQTHRAKEGGERPGKEEQEESKPRPRRSSSPKSFQTGVLHCIFASFAARGYALFNGARAAGTVRNCIRCRVLTTTKLN
jgi:hypothetical protein